MYVCAYMYILIYTLEQYSDMHIYTYSIHTCVYICLPYMCTYIYIYMYVYLCTYTYIPALEFLTPLLYSRSSTPALAYSLFLLMTLARLHPAFVDYVLRIRILELPKIRGALFWGPYNKDPTI